MGWKVRQKSAENCQMDCQLERISFLNDWRILQSQLKLKYNYKKYYTKKVFKKDKYIERFMQELLQSCSIFVEGEYYNRKKLGRWTYIYKNTTIGEGVYREGLMIGKWLELDQGLFNSKQVTFNGEYNQKGMKMCMWDIWFKCSLNKQIKQHACSGCGSYDQEGSQKKIEKWVELDEGFLNSKQVTHNRTLGEMEYDY